MKKFLILPLLLLFTLGVYAEEPAKTSPKRTTVPELVLNYIEYQNLLNDEEFEAYKTIYLQEYAEMKAVKAKIRGCRKTLKSCEKDDECAQCMRELAAFRVEKMQVEQKYLDEYLKVLSAKDYAKVQTAADQYKKKILREIRTARKEKQAIKVICPAKPAADSIEAQKLSMICQKDLVAHCTGAHHHQATHCKQATSPKKKNCDTPCKEVQPAKKCTTPCPIDSCKEAVKCC